MKQMIQKIKDAVSKVIGSVKLIFQRTATFFRQVIESITKAFKAFVAFISWPNWYIIILSVGAFLMAIEVVGTWFGFVFPAVGLFVWLIKKNS